MNNSEKHKVQYQVSSEFKSFQRIFFASFFFESSNLYFFKVAFPCSKKGISFQKKSFIKVILQEI